MKKLLPPKDTYFYSARDANPELIVCGKDYFSQLKESAQKAEKSILICGWSLNLNTLMDDEGTTLEDLLFSVPETVKIKILIWDYIIFYMADRDPFLPLHLAMKNKKNIEFQRFDFHPVMSSMHAKMAIIDDEELFIGGIDLDLGRRDGPYNLGTDETRRHKDGKRYSPFRDYMFRFHGERAGYFARVFRQLWHSQMDQRSSIEPNESRKSRSLRHKSDNIFFSRTVPKFKNNPQDYSSFKMHKWLVTVARDYIYIENQYLTSDPIVDLLIQRLKEPNGPEIVIVVSYGQMPIIEKVSMGALLTEAVKKLHENDPYSRLKIYTLYSGEGDQAGFVKIHSKLILVDDKLLKIGSSNLNNRSMRFDYELDALVKGSVVTAFKERIFDTVLGNGEKEGKAQVGDSLVEAFEKARKARGVLVEVKDILHGTSSIAEYKDYLPLDKKDMTFFERMGQMFVGKNVLEKINLKVAGGALVLALILAGAFVVDHENAKQAFESLLGWLDVRSGMTMMAIFYVAYLILGAFFFPLNAYIFLCGAYFDTAEAFFLALFGAVSTASLTYGVGAIFKSEVHGESKIKKINQLRRLLKKNSLKTLIFLRMVPVAPFPIVNLVCGKYGINFPKYFLGTLLGVAPGSFVLIFMEKRLIDLVKSPDWRDALVVAIILAAGYFLSRLLKKRMSA